MSPYSSLLTPHSSLFASSVLGPQSYGEVVTPLELLNLYYSDGQSTGNKENKLWRKMNALLSWDNILNRGYQADLCPLLFFIITKALPRQRNGLEQNYRSGEIVPDFILSHLKNHYLSSLRRNMILLEELKQVVEEFTRHGIQIIILKGGYLAEHVYADIACRPMGDLDILIKAPDYETCRQILVGMGYLRLPETERNELLHWSFHKNVLGESVKIEVHHRLVKEVFLAKFPMDQISSMRHLPIEFDLVYISWHMIHHGISRLLWLCDICELIKGKKGLIKWDVVHRNSLDFNAEKHLGFTTFLTGALLGPVPMMNGSIPSKETFPYLPQMLLFKIQKKLISKKFDTRWIHLFSMSLFNTKDLINYIPKYINYRIYLA